MKLKADLQFDLGSIWTRDCVVEKMIELSGERFDDFCANLKKDQGFIRKHNGLMCSDGSDTYRCLLVTGVGRGNGILVHSEGYDRARYTGVVPNVHAVIAASRYPTLAALNRRMTGMADYIVAEGIKARPGSRAVVSMDTLEEMFGVDVARNPALSYTLAKMLNDRPEVADWEIDGGKFIITPTAPEMAGPEREPQQNHEPTIGM